MTALGLPIAIRIERPNTSSVKIVVLREKYGWGATKLRQIL